MQSQRTIIFVGLRISEMLQQQLDACNSSLKQFFEESHPDYLQVLHIEYEEYIGKVTESGASLEDLGSMLMNVKTMLGIICPKFRFPDDAIKILAVAPTSAKTYLCWN
jgi:hypothetical protein